MAAWLAHLLTWDALDTWTAATAASAAAACAVPGVYLVLRKQSLLGDALSHTALPGVVGAYLLAALAEQQGWLPDGGYLAMRQILLMAGAVAAGLLTVWLSEALSWLGRIDRTLGLAVVFTTAFAAGLFLLRTQADSVHIDPDCVLFGEVELAILETIPGTVLPRPFVVTAAALLLNLLYFAIWLQPLRAAAFDPGFAESVGLKTRRLYLTQISLASITLVAAFESVGSILAIAMLVLPAATARFLTDHLVGLVAWSIALAILAAVLGHALSFTVPPLMMEPLGFESVESTGTAGAMTLVAGLTFLLALLFGHKGGLITTRRHPVNRA